ncbi:MAG: hypothetical protein LBF02_00425 [Mycoplasmataceae bacterium]|nr:hypothetical protein [Mycoplasmataceae bacterium]
MANAAFNKPLTPSATLAAIIGSKEISRPESLKKIWDYIKSSKETKKDAKDGRKYHSTDAKLVALLGSDFSMFDIAGKVSKNLK